LPIISEKRDTFKYIHVLRLPGFNSGRQIIATKLTNRALIGGLGYVFADFPV
jgi:hypothetical protein